MKRLFLFLLTGFCFFETKAQSYKLTLEAPQYKSGIAYLTYHWGKNLNIEDSAAVSNTGKAVFSGNKKLPGGIYAIVLPGKTRTLDIFIDKDQNIDVKIPDSLDMLNKSIVTGSKENDLFVQYQKQIETKGKLLEAERRAYTQSTTKADSALHEANYTKYNKDLNAYREDIIKNHPNSMMAVLLNAMKEPKVLDKKIITHQDSLDNYYYYKAHYWDGITFMDERVIRTPFFLPKLEKYYREILVPNPDSIIKDAQYQILLSRSCPEMYKFLLNWLTDEYINPKYMGQDAVFVFLFENYHSKGETSWLNEKQMQQISRRYYMVVSNVVGKKAADLEMLDTSGKPTSLYNVNADYTVVCFWDPNCGHCKEELPHLDSIYNASWKKHGVKIYAVLSADSKDDVKSQWIKYINDHKLGDWINVYETKKMEEENAAAQKPSYRQLYDVIMTPTLFFLDSEKRIIGKKLTWQQLDELMHVKWASKEAADKNKSK